MNRLYALLIALPMLASAALAADGVSLAQPNWDRAAAEEAVDGEDMQRTLGDIYRLARAGRSEELLLQVETISEGRSRPDPERDRILYTLALSLGDLGPGYVDSSVLERLAQIRSRTLVPHEEGPGLGVPLYNIRAAAVGALALWRRYESPSVPAVPDSAEKLLSELTSGRPGVTPERIRRAAGELSPAEFELLVAAVPAMPDLSGAAVVLGAIPRETAGWPAVSDRLFELLGHRELGSAAALALARSGDRAILARLADLAGRDEGLVSGRASLAIDAYLAAELER